MEIETPFLGKVKHFSREDLSVRDDDDRLRLRLAEGVKEAGLADLLRLENGEPALKSERFDGRRRHEASAPGGPIGARHDERDLVTRVEERREGRNGERRRPHEDEAHGLRPLRRP